MLRAHRKALDALVEALLERETLDETEILVRHRPAAGGGVAGDAASTRSWPTWRPGAREPKAMLPLE